MNKMQHPNVLGLLGVCLETENGLPYIVLPFMVNGDLKSYLRSKRNNDIPVVNYPKVLLLCDCLSVSNNIYAGFKLWHTVKILL